MLGTTVCKLRLHQSVLASALRVHQTTNQQGALGVIELVKQADTFDIPGGAVTETSTLAWFKEQDALRCHSG